MTTPLRVVQVGAGGMGKVWMSLLATSDLVELVGLVDLDVSAADRALAAAGLEGVVTGASVTEVAAASGAEAVVNVTVPAAHLPVNVEALSLGLPVLCEKPIAPTVAEAMRLAAASEVTGRLLMTSQSRRYYRSLASLKAQLPDLGDIGIVTTAFFLAPRFGGFRDEMTHPLLVDMAIHPFDVARYLLDQEPVSVYCDEFNPSWSWYAGSAATTAIFEMSGGARYVYTGSWCSDGFPTSWNGDWRVSGSHGSATWDGEGDPAVEVVDGRVSTGSIDGQDPRPPSKPHPPSPSRWSSLSRPVPEEIAGALHEFVHALRTGETPSGEVHSNVMSLAMVESAVRSAETGAKVRIDDVLADAWAQAIQSESRRDIRSALESWRSPLNR